MIQKVVNGKRMTQQTGFFALMQLYLSLVKKLIHFTAADEGVLTRQASMAARNNRKFRIDAAVNFVFTFQAA